MGSPVKPENDRLMMWAADVLVCPTQGGSELSSLTGERAVAGILAQ